MGGRKKQTTKRGAFDRLRLGSAGAGLLRPRPGRGGSGQRPRGGPVAPRDSLCEFVGGNHSRRPRSSAAGGLRLPGKLREFVGILLKIL